MHAHLPRCDEAGRPPHVGVQVTAIAKLTALVVATFAACWAPYLTSPAAALEVLQVGTATSIAASDDKFNCAQLDPRAVVVGC